jgi:hypothetical protein
MPAGEATVALVAGVRRLGGSVLVVDLAAFLEEAAKRDGECRDDSVGAASANRLSRVGHPPESGRRQEHERTLPGL